MAFLPWAAVWLAAAPSVDALSAPPQPPQPIMGGEPTEPGEFDTVVGLQIGNSNLCTGTVVSPRVILTAAHCLPPAGGTIEVFYGPELTTGDSVSANEWEAHPSFCPRCEEEVFDFGYVLLPSDFTGVQYPKPLTDQDEWDAAMRNGEDVVLVGYGTTDESEDSTLNPGLGVKRKVTTTIDSFTSMGYEFFAGGEGKDSCKGDSGGPAFAYTESGELRLVGILSRGTIPCGDGGYYGVPYASLCWLRDETGLDLVPPDCADCECLDILPPEEGCSITSERERAIPLAWMLVLLAWGKPRRSQRSRERAPFRF